MEGLNFSKKGADPETLSGFACAVYQIENFFFCLTLIERNKILTSTSVYWGSSVISILSTANQRFPKIENVIRNLL